MGKAEIFDRTQGNFFFYSIKTNGYQIDLAKLARPHNPNPNRIFRYGSEKFEFGNSGSG